MKERSILFTAPMVRTILAGTKTQTRRALRPSMPLADVIPGKDKERGRVWYGAKQVPLKENGDAYLFKCRHGQPGDRLWVREAWKTCKPYDPYSPAQIDSFAAVLWLADNAKRLNGPEEWGRYRHARFMPRWASRITLEITDVRVERLQSITEKDAIAEGVERFGNRWRHYFYPDEPHSAFEFAKNSYASLWEKINGPGSWVANPYVWVISFKKL